MEFKKAEEKILSRSDAIKKVEELKKQGKKVVFTNGCFDLIHLGHVIYLREAKNCGDILVVAVNTDESIKRIKGKDRPILPLSERQRILAAFESADFVTSFEEDSSEPIISEINPDVLVKGGDYGEEGIVGREVVQKRGGAVKPLQLVKGVSTTSIVEKIINRFSEA